jgi:caffeoyl-CoA O-methyltransferase
MVDLINGDARDYLKNYKDISFCLLDAGKEIYGDCYEAIIPNMISGGILIADNVISHRETLKPMIDRVLSDKRVDALIIPIGKGELFCRKR